MELSPTARVILGMLGFGPMSGYEIKTLVDNSTRFFWAASYGQIYPELRRLADAGLIEGDAQAQGGRRRTVFSLTATGHEALASWHRAAPEIQESRDETMLKLFFADAVGEGATEQALEGKRDHHREVAGRLRQIQAGKDADTPSSAMRTLRLGIEWNEWVAGWCERELEELRGGESKRRRT
jgi:DNA-binding PadR family transcriptional regulator